MAVKCGHCRGTDIVYAFDTYQCLSCGGHSKHDAAGSPTVPTSAIETEQSTYDGPGKELIDSPENPPFRAKDPVR
jgi:hypothetical protein